MRTNFYQIYMKDGYVIILVHFQLGARHFPCVQYLIQRESLYAYLSQVYYECSPFLLLFSSITKDMTKYNFHPTTNYALFYKSFLSYLPTLLPISINLSPDGNINRITYPFSMTHLEPILN